MRMKVLLSIVFLSVVSAGYAAPDAAVELSSAPLKAALSKTTNKFDRVEILLKLADLSMQGGDNKSSIEYYRKALAERPYKKSAYSIWMSIGDIYLLDNKYAEAIDAYKEAVSINKLKEDARLKLAAAYEKSELFELSRQEYLNIIKFNSKSFNANYALALLLQRQNLNSQAMECFRVALTIKPETKVYRQIAACAKTLGDPEIAISMLKRVISSEQSYDDYIHLGTLYQSEQRVKEADEVFSKAVKLDPSKPEAYIYLGMLYLESNELIPAEKMFQIALEKLPDEALLHYFLSNTYYRQKNYEAARKEIALARSLAKGSMMALYSGKYEKYLNSQR